jgi:hypothetical protein
MAFDISSAKEVDPTKFDISTATPADKFDLSSAKTILGSAVDQLKDVLMTPLGDEQSAHRLTDEWQRQGNEFKGFLNKGVEDAVVHTAVKAPALKYPAAAIGTVAQMGVDALPIDPQTIGGYALLGSAGKLGQALVRGIPKTSVFKKPLFGTKIKEPVIVPKTEIPPSVPPSNIPVTPEVETPVQTVIRALKESTDVRNKQETLYAQERAKRFQAFKEAGGDLEGEARIYSKFAQLKGELPKAEFESIKGKVGQKQINELTRMIENSGEISEIDKISAFNGFLKLFGESGGSVPQMGELNHLKKVFGNELVDVLLEKRPLFTKMKELGLEVANVPRAIMASYDLSAPMRQGLFFMGRKEWFPAFKRMFPTFGSEKSYNALMKEISNNPHYTLAKESGIKLTDLGMDMATREERFMPQLAERIPLIGRGVRASGRAYTAFLDKLRMDVFSDMVEKAKIIGRDAYKDRDFAIKIADFVNTGTGRGKLPWGLERAAIPLNAMLFSPRLMASRMAILNPMYYIKQDPFIRKEALKSLFATSSIIGTMLAIGKLAGGDVSLDTRNSNALKIKIGNTRLDVMGGFQQYIKVISQLATGKLISSTSGKVTTLGKGYRALNRKEILGSFIESKEAPILSLATTLLKQRDISGKKIDIPKEIGNRFVPMIVQDAVELYKENPKLLPLALLGVFGVGVQTYGGNKQKKPLFRKQ